MKIQTANGYYLPSYFFMKIESDEDIFECIKNNEQTFVHEYLHFLQDLILPYNIRNTLVSNRDFALIASTAFNKKVLKRPFNEWDEDSNLTLKQFSFTWGGEDFINEKQKIVSINREHFVIHTGAKVYGYILITEIGIPYHVGARDFLEYIAHKIESKNWKVSHPAFPYETVDFLFDYYKLDWVTEEVRLCLVEFCLYNDNPLHYFITLLNDLFSKDHELLKSYETCKNALFGLPWKSVGGFEETILTKTERRLQHLKESLSDKYENNNFSSIKEWIDHVIKFSREYLSNRFIFTELFMMDNVNFKERISLFTREIGIPLVFNQKEESASLLPENYNHNDFVQLYAANKLMEYVRSDKSSCPMFSFCSSSRKEIIDDNCINNPILRANYKELCPFGAFVKSYGLHDINWDLA